MAPLICNVESMLPCDFKSVTSLRLCGKLAGKEMYSIATVHATVENTFEPKPPNIILIKKYDVATRQKRISGL